MSDWRLLQAQSMSSFVIIITKSPLTLYCPKPEALAITAVVTTASLKMPEISHGKNCSIEIEMV